VTLVHHQWVRDSLDRGALQHFAAYLLPSGCTALHGYNIFAASRTGLDAGAAGGGLGPALSPGGDGAVFANVKVLNFAGEGGALQRRVCFSVAVLYKRCAFPLMPLQEVGGTTCC
jgi:hypothetical protein